MALQVPYKKEKKKLDVVRAFWHGQAAHLEDQIEEENDERIRKKWEKVEEWGNVPLLPTQG